MRIMTVQSARRRKICRIWNMAASLLAAFPVCHGAAMASEYAEDAFFADIPIVLTASRIAQSPLEAPAPVTIISRETIRASGFTEIHDIFRLVPGFQVADWPYGSPIVVNHGQGNAYPRRLLVLIDGRSVLDPMIGGVDWQDLPIRVRDIERIEVIRSPNQATYGANAFQGVINILTKEPGLSHRSEAVLTAGNLDTREAYFSLDGGDGGFDWKVSGSIRDKANFRDLQKAYFIRREEIERQSLNTRLLYRGEDNQEWHAQIGLIAGRDAVGSRDSLNDPYRNTDFDSRFLQVGWRKSYSTDSEISLQAYHFSRSENDRYLVFPLDATLAETPFIPIDRGLDMSRNDIEFQHRHGFTDELRIAWGAGLRQDEAESDHFLYQQGRIKGTQWQVFGNLEWALSKQWLVNLGGMLENHYYTDTLFSPRIAFNYFPAPNHSVRVGMGNGYRAPTIFEARSREAFPYEGGVADIENWSYRVLEPEENRFIEIGYAGYLDSGLSIDTRLFAEHYTNLIGNQSCSMGEPSLWANCDFDPPAGYGRPYGFNGKFGRFGHYKAFYYYNSGEIDVVGGEFTLDWKDRNLGRFILSHSIISISASGITDAYGPTPTDITRDKDTEYSAPQHSTSLLWSKEFTNGYGASLGYYHVDRMKWPSDGDWQPAYDRFDLRLARHFRSYGLDNEISLIFQNLTGEHTEFDDYMSERRILLSLELIW